MIGKTRRMKEFTLYGTGARVLIDLSRVCAVRDLLNNTCIIMIDEGVTYTLNEKYEDVRGLVREFTPYDTGSSARMLFLVQMFLEEWAECIPIRGISTSLELAVRDLKNELAEELEMASRKTHE